VVWCDDVDAETARLRAAGTPVVVEPYDHPAGHRRAYLADPDGNWLALVDAPGPS
jgi:lactoylglutathione lyase